MRITMPALIGFLKMLNERNVCKVPIRFLINPKTYFFCHSFRISHESYTEPSQGLERARLWGWHWTSRLPRWQGPAINEHGVWGRRRNGSYGKKGEGQLIPTHSRPYSRDSSKEPHSLWLWAVFLQWVEAPGSKPEPSERPWEWLQLSANSTCASVTSGPLVLGVGFPHPLRYSSKWWISYIFKLMEHAVLSHALPSYILRINHAFDIHMPISQIRPTVVK